ncbi:MAG: hypothetical protein IJ300_01720 [Clostridia bacterium]|nr:hypothetical protein [Clostridia bacterium]
MNILNSIFSSMGFSVLFAVCYIGVLVWLAVMRKRKIKSGGKVYSKGIKFLPLLCIALAVFFLRQAIFEAQVGNLQLEIHDENKIFFSFIETLRTFAIDGGYADVIKALNTVYGRTPGWNIYTSLLFIAAPVTGGALILEIVSSIFPRIRLVLCNHIFFWKEVNYFSELNECSLALAESIRKKGNIITRPSIVFTDVYTDFEERDTELYLNAKNIGAICISDDLLHTGIRRKNKKKIFLIDSNEINNLQTLSAMAESFDENKLMNAQIYLFNGDDTFALAGCSIKEQLAKRIPENSPSIVPVNGNRNLVRNLFYYLPLYEPLVGRKDKKVLNVTVMGTGEIGTEAFLSAYWYGQILDCELCINVVSVESEQEFRDKINYVNPDILKTTSACDLLKIYPNKDEMAKPYFKFRYYRSDLKTNNIDELMTAPGADGFRLADSDYFVIALGSDDDNLSVADKVKRAVTIFSLNSQANKNTVISYVIYDSKLCRVLNHNDEKYSNVYDGIYMHAFGALDEIYDTKNVFMEATKEVAEEVGKSYDSIKQGVAENAKRKGRGFYDYWSDIARAAHIKYKAFSAGAVTKSVFNCRDGAAYEKSQQEDLDNYKSMVKSSKNLAERLAWLEHRRWNAYMRICGMRCPADFTKYGKKTKEHKDLDLKLHPCIVECAVSGLKPDLFGDKVKDNFDMLDMVSRDLYYKLYIDIEGKEQEDYKTYDYPIWDF